MATYLELQTEIADQLARSDLTNQIKTAIKDAIEHYQRQQFYFNEERTLTFSTVDGQEFYGSSDNANIPNLAVINVLTATINGNRVPLTAKPYGVLDEISPDTNLEGSPIYYAYYARQIRFYPIPDKAYPIRVSGIWRLTELSADQDENVWTTEARQLIRARAVAALALDYQHDEQMALRARAREEDALRALRAETAARVLTSGIMPTEF